MASASSRRPEAAAARVELPEELAARLDAWLAATRQRAPELATRDLRKGVRALSSLYVERRRHGGTAAALEGSAKRTAFATFYAALHFVAAYHAAARLLRDGAAPGRIVDAGAGTGAAGAGAACALGGRPRILALERSGWALGEARHTYEAFTLAARSRRVRLPAGLPRPRRGDLLCAGWLLNECDPPLREALLGWLEAGARAGARVLVLEPLAFQAAPWWEDAAARLAGAGIASAVCKVAIRRPELVAELDRASGLDHRELGARVLYGPPASGDRRRPPRAPGRP
jgi:hypothetical protein